MKLTDGVWTTNHRTQKNLDVNFVVNLGELVCYAVTLEFYNHFNELSIIKLSSQFP